MQGKKVLTIGCVLTILACGACFLPPPRPTPPPLAPGLKASRRIRVEVANLSPTEHISPDHLGSMLALNINGRLAGTHLKARSNVPPQAGDAVLHVDILQESAVLSSGRSTYNFGITFNGSLTASDGAVLWRASDRTVTLDRVYVYSESELWRDQSVNSVSIPLIQLILKEIFSAH